MNSNTETQIIATLSQFVRILIFVLLVSAILAGHDGLGGPQTNHLASSASVSAGKIIKALESCPSWSDANVDSTRLLLALKKLATNDTPTLRIGIEKFVAKCRTAQRYDIGNMSKLFVLNRLIFAVPEREKFSGPFFGGWEGVPDNEVEMNMLWPLSLTKNGDLRLTGKFSGYSGDQYWAIEEFDHFSVKYGRRQPQQGPTLKSR